MQEPGSVYPSAKKSLNSTAAEYGWSLILGKEVHFILLLINEDEKKTELYYAGG